MVYLLYNVILMVSAVVLVPYYLLRGLRYGKSRRGIRERLGYFTQDQLKKFQSHQVIWLHAVSVGETRAAMPLIRRLRREYPDYFLLISNVTETGHAIAADIRELDDCIFFPFDFSWAARRALKAVSPELVAIVETEIWPNFTRQARLLDIPLVLVNGRISDRSFPRYRFARILFRPILDCFSAFCMQSQVDTERIIAIGASSDRVENTGNLKFDHEFRDISEHEVAERKNQYRLPLNTAIIVAGSTHDGEEQVILDTFSRVSRQSDQEIRLVIIPRHPERKRDVQAMFKNLALQPRFRSELNDTAPVLSEDEVLVVDTLGEVLNLYSVADLVFVGGSLVPVGGHNLLEASLLSKPVVFGPHVHNFKEISKKLIRAGAGIKIENAAELASIFTLLLNDQVRRKAMGEAGRALIAENVGATERTLKQINRLLP